MKCYIKNFWNGVGAFLGWCTTGLKWNDRLEFSTKNLIWNNVHHPQQVTFLWRSFILKCYNAKKFLKLGWHSGMVYNQPDMGRWTDNKELSINSTGKRDSISFAPLCWVITVIPGVHRASKKRMSAGTNCWLAWPQLWAPPHRHGTVLDVS